MSADTLSHQAVRLSAGSHSSRDDGACAVELYSMLADEPFSDRPATVSPVIASFMRSYNDRADEHRRATHPPLCLCARGSRGVRWLSPEGYCRGAGGRAVLGRRDRADYIRAAAGDHQPLWLSGEQA